MTPMQQQANAVINALEEGKVIGLIMAFEKLHTTSPFTKKDIAQYLRRFEIKNVDYWIEWFALDS